MVAYMLYAGAALYLGVLDLDKPLSPGDQHCGDLLCRPQGWRFRGR